MRQRRRSTITELRLAIDCLPRTTRLAMLQGISTNEIIVGAYTDGSGICPMLAAHRAGGRTSLIAFARAWDRFAFRDKRGRRARRATERELLVLKSHLEASLLKDENPRSEMAEAMAEHRALRTRRQTERTRGQTERVGGQKGRPGDPDRSAELRRRPGWAWLRVMRRYDEYQRALSQLERSAAAEERERELVAQSS